jgi:hypothetical protein
LATIQNQVPELQLNYHAFDQESKSGWRSLADQEKYLDAAKLIDRYLEDKQDLTDQQRVMLNFHAGQLYACANQPDQANDRLQSTIDAKEPLDPEKWNAYVKATMAFLRRDYSELLKMREAVAKGPIQRNLKTIDQLIQHFGQPYCTALAAQDDNNQQSEAKKILIDMSKAQWVYYLEHSRFSPTIESLGSRFSTRTKDYTYSTLPYSRDAVYLLASANQEGKKNYIAIVYFAHFSFYTPSSGGTDPPLGFTLLCQSRQSFPNSPPKLQPLIPKSDSFGDYVGTDCPVGYSEVEKIVYNGCLRAQRGGNQQLRPGAALRTRQARSLVQQSLLL